MNACMGNGMNVRMLQQFTNVYSSLSLVVITLVGQLISVFKCMRESDGGERGHVCW